MATQSYAGTGATGDTHKEYQLRGPTGNLTALVDSGRSILTQDPQYGPYGETLDSQAPNAAHQFAGHERDVATGLDAMHAR
jgi:hypothetical protein